MYRINKINKSQKSKDVSFGLSQEKPFIEYVKENLNITLHDRDNKYALIDFYTYSGLEIELKSRSDRYYWGQYEDWSIGFNKFKHGYKLLKERKCKKVLFIFNLFTDNTKTKRNYYVYELTEKRFEEEDTFFLKEGGNYYRGDKTYTLGQIKQQYLIPINECDYFNEFKPLP
jgi:hypothetical protein